MAVPVTELTAQQFDYFGRGSASTLPGINLHEVEDNRKQITDEEGQEEDKGADEGPQLSFSKLLSLLPAQFSIETTMAGILLTSSREYSF